jgi:hypothetical protein
MIYFIACFDANAVKIGITEKRPYLTAEASAFQRLGVAQVNCPLALDLLAITEGGPIEEQALHERFAKDRIRGEWFNLTDELSAHIALLPKPERAPRGWHGQERNRIAV